MNTVKTLNKPLKYVAATQNVASTGLANARRLNRPQFARHLLAIENGTKRGVYEQAALSRRVQD